MERILNKTLKSKKKRKIDKNRKSIKASSIKYINEMDDDKNYKYIFIILLKKYKELPKNKSNAFTQKPYNNAIQILENINEDIKISNMKKLLKETEDKKQNLSTGMYKKLTDYLTNGVPLILKENNITQEIIETEANEKEENKVINNEESKIIYLFSKIYDIGDVKAKELYNKGYRTLEELEKDKDKIQNNKTKTTLLTKNQVLGIEYYYDLLKKIPRKEIDNFKDMFNKLYEDVLKENNKKISNYNFNIAGSYRRQHESSGDIDIIMSSSKEDKELFDIVIKKLENSKDLFKIEYLTKGDKKSMCIVKLNKEGSIARRVDFMYCPPNELGFALLYFTGSKDFNTAIRSHVKKFGLTLNEHGLSFIDKSGKVLYEKGKRKMVKKELKTEEEIFEFLKIKYVEPKDRIDLKSIKLLLKPGENITLYKEPEEEESEEEEPEEPEPEEEEPEEEEPEEPEPEEPEPEEPEPEEEEVEKGKKSKTKTIKVSKDVSKTIKNITVKLSKEKDNDIMENIKEFKLKGNEKLDVLTEEELSSMLKKCINNYHNLSFNDKIYLSDEDYDYLKEYMIKKYPNNDIVNNEINYVELKDNKVKLPYEMWSMNKIKINKTKDKLKEGEKEINKFKKKFKGPYIISSKLDGISALYSCENNIKNLYTRGTGKIGTQINKFIDYLKLPECKDKNIVIRGELIIDEEVFKKKYIEIGYNTSRNFVAGLSNTKNIEDLKKKDIDITDIDFVAYEVIKPENLKPSEQFKLLNELSIESGLKVAKQIDKLEDNKSINNVNLTLPNMEVILKKWKKEYEYNIDGIIIANDEVYERESKNPESAFAFKMDDEGKETTVTKVEWIPSKNGLLIPTIHIEPVIISNSKISKLSGKNARFIERNKIGIGAKVIIKKMGDVIPGIEDKVGIIEGAEVIFPDEDWIWDETHVNIKLKNKLDNKDVNFKRILTFFEKLEIESVKKGTIASFIENHANSIQKIINLSKEEIAKMKNFRSKKAEAIYNSIKDKLEKADLSKIAAASSIFENCGETKFETILKEEPLILTDEEDDKKKIEKLKKIEGIGEKTAKIVVDNIPKFIKFIKELDLEYKLDKKVDPIKDVITETTELKDLKELKLADKIIILSDIKNKNEITKILEEAGAKVVSTVSLKNNINLLITDDKQNKTKKIVFAEKNKIDIKTFEEVKEEYNL